MPPERLKQFWLRDYYKILNGDREFYQDLRKLFKRFGQSSAPQRAPLSDEERRLERAQSGLGKRRGRRPPTERMRKAFEEIAERWNLPKSSWCWERIPPDLYLSFALWRENKEAPSTLVVGPVSGSIQVRAETIVLKLIGSFVMDRTRRNPSRPLRGPWNRAITASNALARGT